MTAVVFALVTSVAVAQNAPVRGVVMLQKADGTKVPVGSVTVEPYRVDIDKGKGAVATTNKKGEFQFAGFPYGQRFALVVSGPGIGPRVWLEAKAGMEGIEIVVNEGDGRKLTEVEVREVAKATPGGAPARGMTEAEKKEQEDLAKKNVEVKAKNDKIQAEDEIARRSHSEGFAALKAKNYDLAIAKFDEGITAVPDYIGSTPVLMAGKMQALKSRGFDLYVLGAKNPDATARLEKYNAAKKEYNDALATYSLAVDLIKKAPAATDPKDQEIRKTLMNDLYTNVIEIHRLMAAGQVDTTKTAEAEAIIKEYTAGETDAPKKAKALTTLGDIMRASGEFDKAVVAYKTVLETTPDNSEVMASLGLSLVAQGTSVDPPNREQMQEGLNYMQKYADTVAILPTDSPTVQEFKKSVKDTVEYLKTEQNLKAQPTKAPRKKG